MVVLSTSSCQCITRHLSTELTIIILFSFFGGEYERLQWWRIIFSEIKAERQLDLHSCGINPVMCVHESNKLYFWTRFCSRFAAQTLRNAGFVVPISIIRYKWIIQRLDDARGYLRYYVFNLNKLSRFISREAAIKVYSTSVITFYSLLRSNSSQIVETWIYYYYYYYSRSVCFVK